MRGLLNAVGAYAIWGCFPLFFNMLGGVPAMSILAYRILFDCVFALLLIVISRNLTSLRQLIRQKKILLWSLLASVLISLNWFVFIWAVGQHRVLETSLGYFITPLVSLLLGRILLKESINLNQAIAGFIATLAILFELFALGGVPWVSIVLAGSFGLYGLVRKIQPMESLLGLTLETLWVVPVALVFVVNEAFIANIHYSLSDYSLLIFSGVLTAIPLLLFAVSVRRLNLVVAGFIMYLNPMMQFMTAVWILGEAVPIQRYVTFVLVWIAMVFFIWGLVQKHRATMAFVAK